MTSYKPVQAVEKALRLLEKLNRQPVTRVRDLALETRLPHSTVIRLLETLSHAGYVTRSDNGAGYCVTERTARLSAGNHGFPAVLTDLRQRADALTQKHGWPSAICTLDGDAMVVRYSTIPSSKFSPVHSTINRRLSLLYRAHGRAYLAFCPEAERTYLLDLLAEHQDDPFDRAELVEQLAAIRTTGFALRAPRLQTEANTMAVPYWSKGRLVATLGLTFFRRSLPDLAPMVDVLKQASRNELHDT